MKYGSELLSPLTFTWLRVIMAMMTLMAVALVQQKAWPRGRDVIVLLLLGIIGNGVYQLLFVNGIARTRVADAALLVATAPAFIGIISHFGKVDRIHRKGMMGIALSIIGVSVIVFGSTQAPAGSSSFLGIALIMCAVLCWSVFTVMLQPYTLRVNPVQLNAITMFGGVIPLLLVTPAALTAVDFSTIPALGWMTLLYSSVISMGVAYLFWFRGVRLIGPTRTAVYANLQPVIAIIFASVVLNEMPTLWQGVGAATIIGGIVLTRS